MKIKSICLFFAILLMTYSQTLAVDLDVKAALLVDVKTDQVLYQKNADERLAPASITKLMTAYLIFDALKQNKIQLKDQVTISPYAASLEESSYHLQPGEKVTVEELLTSIIVVSGNDSSTAMAEHIAGSEKAFVEMMNQKAAELGMKNSHFMNPSGLPDGDNNPATGHYMSARDIMILSRALLKEHPEVIQYSKITEMNVPKRSFKKENTNKLLKQLSGVDGLKTGFTNEAGYCLVSTIDISKTNSEQEEFRLLSVVLGAKVEEKRFEESKKLLLYGKDQFEKINVVPKEKALEKIKILRAKDIDYELFAKEDINVLIPKGTRDSISIDVKLLPKKEMLRKKAGETLGTVEVTKPTQEKITVPLVANKEIQTVNFFTWIFREIKDLF